MAGNTTKTLQVSLMSLVLRTITRVKSSWPVIILLEPDTRKKKVNSSKFND